MCHNPYTEEKNINGILSDATEGDVITSQFRFSEFSDGEWAGTISSLSPGLGYIYLSKNDKSLAFDFSSKNVKAKKAVCSPLDNLPYNSVDARKYPTTRDISLYSTIKKTNVKQYHHFACTLQNVESARISRESPTEQVTSNMRFSRFLYLLDIQNYNKSPFLMQCNIAVITMLYQRYYDTKA